MERAATRWMEAVAAALVTSALTGCGNEPETGTPPGATSTTATTSSTTATGAGASSTGGSAPGGGGSGGAAGAGGGGGAGGGDSHRTSLSVCWLEPTCHRALVVSHGGDWSATGGPPFLSRTAFEQAATKGADGIEADVRVTQDGVPVIAHSSPIELYESWDCSGELIEQMTADEVTACHLGISLTETIQRLDDALAWSAGRLILELDVKESGDLAATIATILAQGAEDRTFILVSTGEITGTIPTVTGWQSIHYMVNIGDPADIAPMLAIAQSHQIFLLEMDRTYAGYDYAQVAALLTNVVQPGGLKGLSSSDQYLPTVQNHKDVYQQGFDVVLSYDCQNGVQAAQEINVLRGYAP